MSQPRERLAAIGRRLAIPAALWVICAIVYVIVAGDRVRQPTPDNHFVHLADSFLHGQLGVLGNRPPGQNDWACYDSRAHDVCGPSAFARPRDGEHWFVSFPPFPAVVILPAVALFGPRIPDALYWAILAGLSPALLFILLRTLREQGKSDRTQLEDLVLTFLFAFGTVFFFTAVQGTVWFAAHVVATPLIILYLLFSLDARYPVPAGLVLGLLFMTRPTAAMGLSLFFAIEALRVARAKDREVAIGNDTSVPIRVVKWLLPVQWGALLRRAIPFAIPILVIAGIAMWMNASRWENPFEFGHRYLMIRWSGRILRWGLFSYHYLSKNLAVFVASLPWLTAREPHVIISRHGLALWVTTPALLLLLWPKRVNATIVGLYVAAAVVCVWNLLYQNTGWVQFGYRFALDYMPALFALLALGGRRILGPGFLAAMVFAIAVNLFGAITFDRAGQYYDDDASQDRLFQPD